MSNWKLGELARAAEAEVHGGVLFEVSAVGTDTRSLPPSSLFVALRGDRFDGHNYVATAVKAGAVAAVVDRSGFAALVDSPVPLLVVDDTLDALGAIAQYVRRLRGQVAAVTGSNGKTTTKELLAAALGAHGEVHKTAGNFNNLIGLPLTVFSWPQRAWAAVLEMGMNAPGEIARLTEIAEPNVGLITNVGPAHLEGLGSIENVARAKGELYAGLPTGAVAVLNADDEMVRNICAPLAGSRTQLWFGRAPQADVRVVRQEPQSGGSVVILAIDGGEIEVDLPLFGAHNAQNAAGAAATAFAMGIAPDDIAKSMGEVSIPGGRMRVLENTELGVRVIDDTYNANPASMRASFATLVEVSDGRKVAVLGDMFELGETAPELHEQVGRAAADCGIDWVLALGEHAPHVVKGARAGGAKAKAFSDIEELFVELDGGLREGDLVLVKGSRGMRTERVVAHLQRERD